MTDHTPGPWVAHQMSEDSPYWMVREESIPEDCGGLVVCASLTKADADLIAAAPDLLDACREAIHYIPEWHELHAELEDTIREAEGRDGGRDSRDWKTEELR